MVQEVAPTKEELTAQIAKEHAALMKDINKANRNLLERAKRHGFTFDLDESADVVTITIGEGSRDTYTQGDNYVFANIELDSNRIVGFTIVEFQEFLKTKMGKQVFSDKTVLRVLQRYGTVGFPPKREGTLIAASELKTLVPA